MMKVLKVIISCMAVYASGLQLQPANSGLRDVAMHGEGKAEVPASAHKTQDSISMKQRHSSGKFAIDKFLPFKFAVMLLKFVFLAHFFINVAAQADICASGDATCDASELVVANDLIKFTCYEFLLDWLGPIEGSYDVSGHYLRGWRNLKIMVKNSSTQNRCRNSKIDNKFLKIVVHILLQNYFFSRLQQIRI